MIDRTLENLVAAHSKITLEDRRNTRGKNGAKRLVDAKSEELKESLLKQNLMGRRFNIPNITRKFGQELSAEIKEGALLLEDSQPVENRIASTFSLDIYTWE